MKKSITGDSVRKEKKTLDTYRKMDQSIIIIGNFFVQAISVYYIQGQGRKQR